MTGNFAAPRRDILAQIEEGMPVYDQHNEQIGTVDYIQFGDEDPSTPEVESATAHDPAWRDKNLVDNLAEAFTGADDLPETLRNRMLRMGYIKINTGLLRSDRYALPEQIAGLSGDGIKLNVLRDELIAV